MDKARRAIRGWTEHHLNALHLYCLMVYLGIPRKTALAIAAALEHHGLHRAIY